MDGRGVVGTVVDKLVDTRVDTAGVEAHERGEYWQHGVRSALFPLDTMRDRITDFDGRLQVTELGGVTLARVSAQAHSVSRSQSLIDRDERGAYKISVQLRGVGVVRQDGREAELRVGDLAVYDVDRPYSLHFGEPMEILVFMFPRERLRLPREQFRALTATRIRGDGGLGAVIAPYLTGLAREAHQLEPTAAVLLADSVVDLVSGVLMHQAGAVPDCSPSAVVMRAKSFVDERLADPALDAGLVADAVHLSVRSLQRLFAGEGIGVAEWIRVQRLEQCRRDLLDPTQRHRSISAVAAQWGMPDSSHFSRVFKAAFGRTPREYRTEGL